jgi:hypothetical protein
MSDAADLGSGPEVLNTPDWVFNLEVRRFGGLRETFWRMERALQTALCPGW